MGFPLERGRKGGIALGIQISEENGCEEMGIEEALKLLAGFFKPAHQKRNYP